MTELRRGYILQMLFLNFCEIDDWTASVHYNFRFSIAVLQCISLGKHVIYVYFVNSQVKIKFIFAYCR